MDLIREGGMMVSINEVERVLFQNCSSSSGGGGVGLTLHPSRDQYNGGDTTNAY